MSTAKTPSVPAQAHRGTVIPAYPRTGRCRALLRATYRLSGRFFPPYQGCGPGIVPGPTRCRNGGSTGFRG